MRSNEAMSPTTPSLQLEIGIGQIDPKARVERGELQEDQVNNFCEALRGDEFYIAIDPEAIPCCCVDGRCAAHGSSVIVGPNAAAGTFSLVVADALSLNIFRTHPATNEKVAVAAPVHARRIFRHLSDRKYKIGGHRDDRARGVNSGCGAQDKFDRHNPGEASILDFIHKNGDELQAIIGSLGEQVPEEVDSMITSGARKLISEGYAMTGVDISKAYESIGGKASVMTLSGEHKEVALVVNTQPGTTLNREKLREAFGDKLQTFNLDLWALRNGADALALNQGESDTLFQAALYFNVATAAVLAKNVRIIVR